ncbi:diaminopimelate dehydrogenase [Cerasibacillus terrae]|uniref:Meso-diaminopimelate D-dehydrogenase n=1 Tax=Cerasibacillus terrae TaxID=2498845 RepID=A0A5C8NUW2_9BACI|nr:diaminopimelate dehydrogenase [Cerasibacillus terrae]TXL64973.1 diaminopimelate dehydrogenase [Cerasibacillus terrae]
MAEKVRIGIVGYGNLGRGAELAVEKNPDMELAGIFTRRDPNTIQTATNANVYCQDNIRSFQDKLDVLILCGGSASDLPEMSPELARLFPIVDSYDNHAKIPDHYKKVNQAAEEAGKLAIISAGWDPGLFSLNRLLGEIVIPDGGTHTFWGKGLSQGHSEAVRRVEGVKKGVQYTVPMEEILEDARNGKGEDLTAAERHKRVCYIVADEKDHARIEEEIKTMPDYFAPYDTTVHFIDEETFDSEHQKMRHGGFVIRSGNSSKAHKQAMEFSLTLESNPEFTASVLVAYARAAYHLHKKGETGAKTPFDIPFSAMTHKTSAEIMKDLL